MKKAKLILKDGTEYIGKNFGADVSVAGEVVFATGMTGYPEALTDPSFCGQILVFTYPIIGNYGVPKMEFWESKKIQVSGLIVSNYIDTPSHHEKMITLSEWFKKEKLPLIEIKDTRAITEKLRDSGTMLGKIIASGKNIAYDDPNKRNLVAEVSTKKILHFRQEEKNYKKSDKKIYAKNKGTVVLIDCGTKWNICRRLVAKGQEVAVVPWDTDVTNLPFKISAVVISNGPGNPVNVKKTITNVKKIMAKEIPILGICLGNQILTLAAGGDTYKLKFGHRSQNQPVVERRGEKIKENGKCYLTTQNHGFAVNKIPNNFREWFYNANDNTNEGIMHKSLPFMSIQFHPESTPGPTDTDWIFDYFLKKSKIL